MSVNRTWARGAVATAAACMLVAPATAWAHLEPVPGQVVAGKTATVTFRVPNERPQAFTVGVRLELPAEFPLATVRVRTTAGWTAEVAKAKLDKPVMSGRTEITEAFRTITWTAAPGMRIGAGEFAEFAVTMGPMPTTTDKFVINAVQTYDNGEVVNWNQPPAADGSEPEHPAPVLSLTAQNGAAAEEGGDSHATPASTPATASSDNTALWLGGAGLALGALALGIAVGTLLRLRRRPARVASADAS
jgi:periplasmic copper chaperone A